MLGGWAGAEGAPSRRLSPPRMRGAPPHAGRQVQVRAASHEGSPRRGGYRGARSPPRGGGRYDSFWSPARDSHVTHYNRLMAAAKEKLRREAHERRQHDRRLGAVDPLLSDVNILNQHEVGRYVRAILDGEIAKPLSQRRPDDYALMGHDIAHSPRNHQARRPIAFRADPNGFQATLAVPWQAPPGEAVPPLPRERPHGARQHSPRPHRPAYLPSSPARRRASPVGGRYPSPARAATHHEPSAPVPLLGSRPSLAHVRAVLGTTPVEPPLGGSEPLLPRQTVNEMGAVDDEVKALKDEVERLVAEQQRLLSSVQRPPPPQQQHHDPTGVGAARAMSPTRPPAGASTTTLNDLRQRVSGLVRDRTSRPATPYV